MHIWWCPDETIQFLLEKSNLTFLELFAKKKELVSFQRKRQLKCNLVCWVSSADPSAIQHQIFNTSFSMLVRILGKTILHCLNVQGIILRWRIFHMYCRCATIPCSRSCLHLFSRLCLLHPPSRIQPHKADWCLSRLPFFVSFLLYKQTTPLQWSGVGAVLTFGAKTQRYLFM